MTTAKKRQRIRSDKGVLVFKTAELTESDKKNFQDFTATEPTNIKIREYIHGVHN